MGAKLSSIPPAELEEAFVHAFRGVVPNDKRFLGGETIGELFDRVLPALERLVADESVGHGPRRRARRGEPGDPLLRPHRRAHVPRPLRAGAGLPQRPRRRRRLGRPRGQRRPGRPRPPLHAPHADGAVLAAVPTRTSSRNEREGGIALSLVFSNFRLGGGHTWSLRGPGHLSFDTVVNVPFVNLTMRSHATGCWSLPTCAAGCRAAGTGSPRSSCGTPASARPASGSGRPCTSAARTRARRRRRSS